MPNPLIVHLYGVSYDDISVSASGATVEASKKKRGYYTIRPTTGSREVRVLVAGKNSKGKMVVLSKPMFKARRIPTFPARIGALANNGKPVSHQAIHAQRRMTIDVSGFPYYLETEIASFKVTVYDHNGKTEYFHDKNNFTKEFRNHLKFLRTGNAVAVSEIKYTIKGSDSKMVYNAPSVYVPIR